MKKMVVAHLVAAFCALVITEVHGVIEILVPAQTVKLGPMETTVNCVPITFKDQSAISANLDIGGCQRMAVEVRIQGTMSETSLHRTLRMVSLDL